MKTKLIPGLLILLPFVMMSQTVTPDTVEVELAGSSKVIFITHDSNDLQQLKQYDFQALFDDILVQLEKKDTTQLPETAKPAPPSSIDHDVTVIHDDEDDWDHDWDDEDDYEGDHTHNRFPHSRQIFNMDFGMNNYFENGNFQSTGNAQYTVHPWGSWYVGFNGVHRTHFSEHFSLEASLGVSWYNFKFEEENTLITETEDGVSFQPDPRELDFTKSKLTVSYLNVAIIPMFNTNDSHHYGDWWHSRDGEFRIGVGPYAGYRLDSYTKQQYEIDGDKHRDKDHNNFYIPDIRYGLRLQVGVHALDLFFNYDLSTLFTGGDSPELNAYSFGITF
jgi:hypothetical protein